MHNSIMQNFEFIYFFMEENTDNSLVSPFDYKKEDLNKIEKILQRNLQQVIPLEKTPPNIITPWWGELKNLEFEKKINSKITSTLLGLELGNDFTPSHTHIISSLEELKRLKLPFSQRQFIKRSPFHSSGKGSSLLTENNVNDPIKEDVIITPLLNKKFEIGCCVNEQDHLSFHLAHYPHFTFMGGTVYRDDEELFRSLGLSFKDHFNAMEKIISFYRSLGYKGRLNIDSLYYEEEGKIKPYYLMEVNARRSMGLFLQTLKKLIPPHKKKGDLILTPLLLADDHLIKLSPDLPKQSKKTYFKTGN